MYVSFEIKIKLKEVGYPLGRARPAAAKVRKWLREKQNIDITVMPLEEIESVEIGTKNRYSLVVHDEGFNIYQKENVGIYEIAEDDGIIAALNYLIKPKE